MVVLNPAKDLRSYQFSSQRLEHLSTFLLCMSSGHDCNIPKDKDLKNLDLSG